MHRLLGGETGMARRGAECCLFVPEDTAMRADAEAEMTRWFRRNGAGNVPLTWLFPR